MSFEGKVKKCLITTEEKNEEETELPNIIPKDSFLLIHIKL